MTQAEKKYRRAQVFAVLFIAAMLGVTARSPLAAALAPNPAPQAAEAAGPAADAGPPPSSVGFFPLSAVHRGLKGTAWTVFEGSVPEPMEVEILGVLRGELGPGKDLILARLHGTKPEYTGVVAGMSGSPVYIEGKLAGALSYRIGQFSKEPIAGITPIQQMLEVRDMPLQSSKPPAEGGSNAANLDPAAPSGLASPSEDSTTGLASGLTFSAMETPLLMTGFDPQAVRLWKQRMAGTGLEDVSAGGGLGSSGAAGEAAPGEDGAAPVVPGSAVSLEMVRGDLEIAATCTVTYIDPQQLLACGHPVMQSGAVSIPMTAAEVVATVPSPLNAFKIVNTGRTIGAFTQDRDSAIRGELGVQARMIPVTMSISAAGAPKPVERKVEVIDLPSLTANAVLISIYQTLLQSNRSGAETTYHITGEIQVEGRAPVPVDAWGTPGEQMAAQLAASLAVAESFNRLYSNASRRQPMQSVHLRIEVIPGDRRTELEGVRLISSSIVHAGDTAVVEATLRPWGQAERNLRIPFTLPSRLEPGTLRLLVGSAVSLDRTQDAAAQPSRPPTETAVAARLSGQHRADRLYISLLMPESQASLEGHTLESLPLSMANTLESQRTGLDVGLHGESIVPAAEVPAGGVLNGQQILTLHVDGGAGLH